MVWRACDGDIRHSSCSMDVAVEDSGLEETAKGAAGGRGAGEAKSETGFEELT